jgi:putative zinc finger protein
MSMTCHECQPLLSAYVDRAIGGDERAAVATHLGNCLECRALAEDLASIRAAASSLEPLLPPAHVWHQLSAAAGQTRRSPFQLGWFGWRPLTAVAMSAVIAAGLWRVGTLLQPAVPTPASSQIAEVTPVADTDSDPEAHYTVAIARLEEVTRADGDVLDQETAGAMNAGLMVIDDAIDESRAALRSEPQSESAQESLFAALRRKVALLQEMLALINEMRKGNQEGAARILSEINR